jgi:hypothetical protein
MFHKVGLYSKSLAAAPTLEHLALVCFHVCSQVGSVGKLLSAMSTAERLFSGVRSHVSLQQPGPGESLTAHITLVAEAVCENVHRQGWRAHIHLLTHRTGLGRLRTQRLVGLSMPG